MRALRTTLRGAATLRPVVIWMLVLSGLGAHAGQAGAVGTHEAHELEAGLTRLRSQYLSAVHEENAIDAGLKTVAEMRSGAVAAPRFAATLAAYEGALITLRAKHAFWPSAKLRHLRQGLAVLDSVVSKHPAHAEARYLRLMSCYYLPGLLGRSWSVREDFTALAGLLPQVGEDYPPDLRSEVTQFILRHGQPTPEQRRNLELLLLNLDVRSSE